MNRENEKEVFRSLFELSRPVLTAMGDSNRQLIIRYMIEHCGEGGSRVGDIQKNTNISRTAVSHHLKILRETGVVTMNRIGTKNYYYLDSQSSSFKDLIAFVKQTEVMMNLCTREEL